MDFRKKLLNPFVLVGQGFVAGAILFYSTASEPPAPAAPPASMQSAPQIAGI